jgi:hypothetical protein
MRRQFTANDGAVDRERIPVGERNYKWAFSLPEKAEGVTMRSSAVLRCKSHRSMYVNTRDL